MALTQTQVSQLYISLFGRASEGEGNKFWQNGYNNQLDLAKAMLESAGAKAYFGEAFNDDKKFIEHIYKNTLNRDITKDLEGMKFWTDLIKVHGRPFIVNEMIKAITTNPANAGSVDQKIFNNKVAISNYAAGKVNTLDAGNAPAFLEILGKITDDPASLETAKAFVDTIPAGAASSDTGWVSSPEKPGEEFTLTSGKDEKTANVFKAPMIYTPGGTDRIKSLQDDDVLTGAEGRTDNTLYVDMGKITEESDGDSRTPTLNNIQNVNVTFTGDTHTLDLRYADSVNKISIDQITKLTKENVKITTISKAVDGLRVKNAAKDDTAVTFDFKKGVLAGNNDSTNIHLDNVLADSVSQTSGEGKSAQEGFETVNLVASNGVDLKKLQLNQIQNLKIKGSGDLNISHFEAPATPEDGLEQFEQYKSAGVSPKATIGLKTLDASEFTGKLSLDISEIIAPEANPYNSGVVNDVKIIGSNNNDVFYTGKAPSQKTKLDSGKGEDSLVMIDAGISTTDLPTITNTENLVLRTQKNASQAADLDAFDASLSSVTFRNENMNVAAAAEFGITNVSKELAESGKIVLKHSVDTGLNKNSTKGKTLSEKDVKAVDVIVKAELKDFSGKDDLLSIKVENDNNTQFVFNYDIESKGVENITINDADTESNIVGLTGATQYTGTVKLVGGEKGDSYTIKDQLLSKTIDGSEQVSNLRIQVGKGSFSSGSNQVIPQEIKLGAGDDILTFNNIDDFDKGDKVTDAGGYDIVRAAFSKNSTLDIADIEELHVVATNNVELDIAKAKVEKVVIMSKEAVDNKGGLDDLSKITPEPFGNDVAKNVDTTKIITFKNSNLKELNFFGDLDDLDQLGTATEPYVDEAFAQQNFNGVTLEDNEQKDIKVNINSSLDDIKHGAKAYNLGKLTVHGSENLTIEIKNENKAGAVTTIDNVEGKNLKNIVLVAAKDVNLGTVTADVSNRIIEKFDASKVGGDVTANVRALGKGSEVLLTGNGDHDFSALGSAGDEIKIKAGDGDNKIEGSAQSDTITSGNGHNVIKADRGDNVVIVGKGDDRVFAKDGNDTITLGKGYDVYLDNLNTKILATKATTSITKHAGAAFVGVDIDGDNTVDVNEVVQWIAVGEGSELKVQWEGADLVAANTTIDGRSSTLVNSATTQLAGDKVIKGTHNPDLILIDGNDGALNGNAVVTVNGNAGNDVAMIFGDTTNSADKVSLYFNGGEGNDAAIGGHSADYFVGGKGADVLVMQNSYNQTTAASIPGDFDGATDIVRIADGESIKGSHDVVYAFDTRVLTAPQKDAQGNMANSVLKVTIDAKANEVDGAADAAHTAATAIHTELNKLITGFTPANAIDATKVKTAKTDLKAAQTKLGELQAEFVKAEEALKIMNEKVLLMSSSNPAHVANLKASAKAISDEVKSIGDELAKVKVAVTKATEAVAKGEESLTITEPTAKTAAQNAALTLATEATNEANTSVGQLNTIKTTIDPNGGTTDVITKTGAFPTAAAGRDALDLDNDFVALVAKFVNGQDSGSIKAHKQDAKGFVTFFSTEEVAKANDNLVAGEYADPDKTVVIINSANLNNALEYLAKEFNNTGSTVAFAYDRNGDNKFDNNDSIFVFQDGTEDTVVELVGTINNAGLINAEAGLQNATGTTAGLISIV